jgi:hypothetical protein
MYRNKLGLADGILSWVFLSRFRVASHWAGVGILEAFVTFFILTGVFFSFFNSLSFLFGTAFTDGMGNKYDFLLYSNYHAEKRLYCGGDHVWICTLSIYYLDRKLADGRRRPLA